MLRSSAINTTLTDHAPQPQPRILTCIGASIFHSMPHGVLGAVSIAIGARVVDWNRRITATQVPRLKSRLCPCPPKCGDDVMSVKRAFDCFSRVRTLTLVLALPHQTQPQNPIHTSLPQLSTM
jgi:hypothetical protein